MDFASQPEWRSEVRTIEFHAEDNWIEFVDPGSVEIHISVEDQIPYTKLVLQTGSPGSFRGRYVAEFEAITASTAKGSFSETSTSLGYMAKMVRWMFVDEGKLIDKYSSDAGREIERRRFSTQAEALSGSR